MRKRGSLLESSSSTEYPLTDPPGVRAGRLGRPNGLKGFLGLYVEDEDLGYFEPGSTVVIDGRPHVIRAIRRGNRGHEVAFEGVTDRSTAEQIRNLDVLVHERRSLNEGEFWPADLVGRDVRPGGGKVAGIAHGLAQDRLIIEREGSTFEVPFVDELVPTVNLAEGFVEIVDLPGLTESSD